MADVLVTGTFRHASGALARNVSINITARGSSTVLDTVITSSLGTVAFYIAPGAYDYKVLGATIPFEAVATDPTGQATVVHTQSTPAATWTITHNLNGKPPVRLFLTSDPTERVYTDVKHPDLNTAVVEWPSAETGWAYL